MFVLANVRCSYYPLLRHFFPNLSLSESYVVFGFFRTIMRISILFLSFSAHLRPGFHFALSKTEL